MSEILLGLTLIYIIAPRLRNNLLLRSLKVTIVYIQNAVLMNYELSKCSVLHLLVPVWYLDLDAKSHYE